jgi:hypothetical protein
MISFAATLELKENNVSMGTIAFPVGNYSSRKVATHLKTQLNTLGALTYTVTAPNQAAFTEIPKFIITTADVVGDQPSLTANTQELGDLLGMTANVESSFVAASWTSPNNVNFHKHQAVAILMSNVHKSVVHIINSEGVAYNEPIIFRGADMETNSRRLTPQSTTSVTIKLVDGYDNSQVVDLNGYPWTFQFKMFKTINLARIQSSWIHYQYREIQRAKRAQAIMREQELKHAQAVRQQLEIQQQQQQQQSIPPANDDHKKQVAIANKNIEEIERRGKKRRRIRTQHQTETTSPSSTPVAASVSSDGA